MSDFTIEAKVRSKIGKIQPIEDTVKGDADDVIVTLTHKYSSKRIKKNLGRKLGIVFDEFYKGCEELIDGKQK